MVHLALRLAETPLDAAALTRWSVFNKRRNRDDETNRKDTLLAISANTTRGGLKKRIKTRIKPTSKRASKAAT